MSSFAGKFLVARHVLSDPHFNRSVVLLLQHGPEGAFGLVVNRPAKIEGLPFPVFAGGPCSSQGLLLLHGYKEWADVEDGIVEGQIAPGILLGDASCLQRLDDLPADAEMIRSALLDAFDRQQQVDIAARIVARHLTLGHSSQALIAALGRALLREDAGFHMMQNVQAAVHQYLAWQGDTEAAPILIAAARYLAAHSPTPRARRQTADVARRLMRGGSVHEAEA